MDKITPFLRMPNLVDTFVVRLLQAGKSKTQRTYFLTRAGRFSSHFPVRLQPTDLAIGTPRREILGRRNYHYQPSPPIITNIINSNKNTLQFKNQKEEKMVTLIVATTIDPASINPATALLSKPGWRPGPSLPVSHSIYPS